MKKWQRGIAIFLAGFLALVMLVSLVLPYV